MDSRQSKDGEVELEIDLRGLHPDAVEELMLGSERIERESDARRARSGEPGIECLIGYDPINGRVVYKKPAEKPSRKSEG